MGGREGGREGEGEKMREGERGEGSCRLTDALDEAGVLVGGKEGRPKLSEVCLESASHSSNVSFFGTSDGQGVSAWGGGNGNRCDCVIMGL